MTDLKYSHDDDHHDTPTPDATIMDSKSLPAQKRRRVGRACDECRRKKIKCDGKQPCTHCTVYSYGMRPICLYLEIFPFALTNLSRLLI